MLPYDGRFAPVGPLIVPGESCCFTCFELRRAGNLEYGSDFEAVERTPVAATADPAFAAMVAALAAHLVLRWVVACDRTLPEFCTPSRPDRRSRSPSTMSSGPALLGVLARRAVCTATSLARGGCMSVDLPTPLRRAVSPYTGIVRSLEACLHFPDEPPLHRCASAVSRSESLLDAPLAHLSGIGGAGLSRAEAAAAAVGEALERYSATFVPREQLVLASAAELGPSAVTPERFALFSAAQHAVPDFPFVRFDSDLRVPWVRAASLPDGEEAWLPAELVFLGDPVGDGADRIGYATSSGMACAETVDAAVSRGLCELLERDAFMIVWANRLSLPLLDWVGDSRLSELDSRYFAPTGLGYAVVDLSAFHRLPSLLAVVRAPAGCSGALGVGAGTAASLERAFWKALSEGFAARAAGAKLALLRHDEQATDGARDVVSFEDHIAYYADHARARAADFLDAGGERSRAADIPLLPGSTPGEQVRALCERIEAAGSSAYVVDVTSPDVAPSASSSRRLSHPSSASSTFRTQHVSSEAAGSMPLPRRTGTIGGRSPSSTPTRIRFRDASGTDRGVRIPRLRTRRRSDGRSCRGVPRGVAPVSQCRPRATRDPDRADAEPGAAADRRPIEPHTSSPRRARSPGR